MGGIVVLMVQENNLYATHELLLTDEDLLFYVFEKDICKLPLSRKLRKGLKRNDVIEKEYCYSISYNLVKDEYYHEQLPKARYTKILCILNENKQIVQKVPILKVIQTRSGALNFGIDRATFTSEYHKRY